MSLDLAPALSATEEARRQIEICNACRYCEGFCSVFPAMTRNMCNRPKRKRDFWS